MAESDVNEITLNAERIHAEAVDSLFGMFEEICEGAIAVDDRARIVWINDKYRTLLGIPEDLDVIGQPVESLISNSLLREIVRTGKPILLDLMEVGGRWFVVTRLPMTGPDGRVVGAVGFVLFDHFDYLKPIVGKFNNLTAELERTRRRLAQSRRAKYTFSQIAGQSNAITAVKRQAKRASRIDSTVLLLGETGTGKELLAQAIHNASERRDRPFVSVNMAAIPETLAEAEFFGAAAGAYTGADRKGRAGKFKIADGGTLFFDELGQVPMTVQGKLLRVLQEREYEPLGSDRVERVDVRVIAATGEDLEARVTEGTFRADLYYRLNILPIQVPPLRERLEDVPILVEFMLEDIAQEMGTTARELSPEALALLMGHVWPGNVRELRNTLERAYAFTDVQRLEAKHLNELLPASTAEQTVRPAVVEPPSAPLDLILAEAERELIRAALSACRNNKVQAAKRLGISRARLYDKLAKYPDLS